MSYPENEVLGTLVSRVFKIDDITLGEPARGLIARYRGSFLGEDTAAAYDQLAGSLAAYEITPLFRLEQGSPVIFLVPRPPDPKPARVSVNIILFILTLVSVMLVGGMMAATEPAGGGSPGVAGQILDFARFFLAGWPYALSLLSILLAHEFGHYLMSRHHHTAATLPYFIPLPLPPLGTMGAAILMRGTPKNKRVLFDIGVAGPLAGIIVAIPVLLLGLSLSHLDVIEAVGGTIQMEGNSILYLAAKYLIFGQLLPAPADIGGLSPLAYWLRYFFTARPIPVGATDVFIHPVAFAGWAGLLVTALNLIPAGTLDGGHVIYALFGDKARRAYPFILAAVAGLGIFWNGWWIWAVMLVWLGRVHAEPLDQITPLDRPRLIVAAITIAIFLLTFSPVPFSVLTL
jgi:membrane-associated protease RseP (regulator of RpoE activity)